MGNIGFENLRGLGLVLRDTFGLNTFVETGTYKCKTTLWAADHFKQVITVEAYEPYYKNARTNERPSITYLFGDSRDKLAGVLEKIEQPALLWLDAHWCGSYEKSAGTPGECPIREELEAVRITGVRHFILIDDARLFVQPPPHPHDPAQWPSLAEIKSLLPDNYETIIWNDAIICIPAEAAPIVHKFIDSQKMEVIVLTSNKYLHCLLPFSILFNRYWKKEQPVKIIRYEIRPQGLPINFTNFAIGNQADYTWSSGLIKYLYHHPGELILLMLEDYFLSQPVNIKAVEMAWAYMLHHPEIAKIDLSDDRLKVDHTDYNDTFILSADDAPFQTSVQAAIWRKDFLLQFLNPTENPWQFEQKGTKRVIAARQAGKFSGLILGFKEPPIVYVNAVGGAGRKPGEWDFKRIPGWMKVECSLA